MGPEFSAVAAAAVDVSVRTVVQVGGVQRATAVSAVEATSMPDLKDGTGRKIFGNSPPIIFIFILIYIQQIITRSNTTQQSATHIIKRHKNMHVEVCLIVLHADNIQTKLS
jgi:hypothetical protein